MAKLVIVWNRDKPKYDLTVKGFSVTRASEKECLTVAVEALERALDQTKQQLAGKQGEEVNGTRDS